MGRITATSLTLIALLAFFAGWFAIDGPQTLSISVDPEGSVRDQSTRRDVLNEPASQTPDSEIPFNMSDVTEGSEVNWRDGDRTLSARIATNLIVQSNLEVSLNDIVVRPGTSESIVVRQSKHGDDHEPVFISSGGQLMTLPGGVVLVFDQAWGADDIVAFFERTEIAPHRIAEQTFTVNSFLIETAPGFASLHLANRLATEGGVVISVPNWKRRIVLH